MNFTKTPVFLAAKAAVKDVISKGSYQGSHFLRYLVKVILCVLNHAPKDISMRRAINLLTLTPLLPWFLAEMNTLRVRHLVLLINRYVAWVGGAREPCLGTLAEGCRRRRTRASRRRARSC